MKNTVLLTGMFALFLISCPNPVESRRPVDPVDPQEPDSQTKIVFDNTNGICPVLVYNDYRREDAHKTAEVAAGNSSAAIPWQPSDSYPFYFSYSITLNGVTDFLIDFIPDIGKDQKAVRIDANITNNIVIPKLEETLSGPDALLSEKSYIAIQNMSSYSFQLYRNNVSIKPDKAASPVVNTGERVLYTINPGAASPYSLLVGTETRGFIGTVEAFEAGHYYLFSFNGTSISLFSEIPVTAANMRPPEPDVIVPAVPAIPAAPVLTAGDSAIAAQWAETPGAERYEVYAGTGTEPPASPVRTVYGTSALLDGLTNKAVYSVWLKAVNSEGSSALSPPARARPWPAAEAPETPARPQVVGGVNQLTVTWSAAGGAASYEVYRSTANTEPSAPALSVSETRAVLTGLNNGVTYYVWVRAVNAAGKSGYSLAEIGAPRVPTAPPAAPGRPVLTPGSRELAVSWEPVEMASAYEVWAGIESNSASATKRGVDITGGLTQAALTGLENETTYYVWVKAKNAAGTSGFSQPAYAATLSALAVPPLAPAAPVVTAGSRELTVSWQAADGAESYEVWAGTSNNSAEAVKQGADTTELSAAITNLVNGTAYYVWIKAKNRTGISGFSPVASGTPSAFAAPPAAPAAPTVSAGSGELQVNWQAVEGAETYEVWAGTSTNSAEAAKRGADTSELSAVITDLAHATVYYVWIKAKNSRGASGFSPPASGTPLMAGGLYKGETFATAEKTGNQNLEQALSYIASYAVNGDNYFIVLAENPQCPPLTLSYSGKTIGVTLMTNGTERTVQLASNGSLFTVNSGVTLTLETNVTLTGKASNSASLVKIDGSGKFTMNGGEISDNTVSYYGGGVYVNGGTFTMNGGRISGNTVLSSYSSSSGGGGVYISSGTFAMNSGEISGNTASSSYSGSSTSYLGGGGVYISGGTFTMSGGKISGNIASPSYSGSSTSYLGGGGVYVSGGAFAMNGGEISDNIASFSSYFSSSGGGGVYVSGGTFNKASTGGLITGYGNNTITGNKVVRNDSVQSGQGHAVYVSSSKLLEKTVTPDKALNSSSSGAAGGWTE